MRSVGLLLKASRDSSFSLGRFIRCIGMMAGASLLMLAPSTEAGETLTAPPRGVPVAPSHFDEAGGSVASDATGNYTGALSPTGATFVPGGIAGHAIQLSRNDNGYVRLRDVLPQLNRSYSLSVCFTVPTPNTTEAALFARHQPGSANGYYLTVSELVPDMVTAY